MRSSTWRSRRTSCWGEWPSAPGDPETAGVADGIAMEERTAAERIAGTWDEAMDAALADLSSDPVG